MKPAMIRGLPWARAWFAASLVACAAVMLRVFGGAVTPTWLLAVVGVSLIGAVAAGSFVMGSGLFARPILGVTSALAGARVALTFDDGPHPVHTRRVMDLLESAGHRGTFFVIGKKAAVERALLSEIVSRGHGVANHSYDHAHNTPALPVATLVADFTRAADLLSETRGKPEPWFRAPMGILSPRVVQAVKKSGLELVGWTATARDGTKRATADSAYRRLESALTAGAILVLHDAAEREDRAPIVEQVLPRLLAELTRRGLRSVTLDELLTKPETV